jgi:hypothetical protein
MAPAARSLVPFAISANIRHAVREGAACCAQRHTLTRDLLE